MLSTCTPFVKRSSLRLLLPRVLSAVTFPRCLFDLHTYCYTSHAPPSLSLLPCEQIHCRNRHGSNRRGKKVTGLEFVETAQLRHRGQQHHQQHQQQPCDPSFGPAAALAGAAAACATAVEDAVGAVGAVAAAAAGALNDGLLRGGKADSMSAQYSLLTTTNDSRLRVYDLDNFAMVRAGCLLWSWA